MKTVLTAIGFLTLATCLLTCLRTPLAPAAADEGEIAGIDWKTDLDAARSEAETSGRPLLVVFR